jgi:hypothetical protein
MRLLYGILSNPSMLFRNLIASPFFPDKQTRKYNILYLNRQIWRIISDRDAAKPSSENDARRNRKDLILIDFVIKITKEDKILIDNLEKA